jgi:hypothetical protein
MNKTNDIKRKTTLKEIIEILNEVWLVLFEDIPTPPLFIHAFQLSIFVFNLFWHLKPIYF